MVLKVVKIYLSPEELADAHELAVPGAKATMGLKLGRTAGLAQAYKDALKERAGVRHEREVLLETTARPYLDLCRALGLTPDQAGAFVARFLGGA